MIMVLNIVFKYRHSFTPISASVSALDSPHVYAFPSPSPSALDSPLVSIKHNIDVNIEACVEINVMHRTNRICEDNGPSKL